MTSTVRFTTSWSKELIISKTIAKESFDITKIENLLWFNNNHLTNVYPHIKILEVYQVLTFQYGSCKDLSQFWTGRGSSI